MQENYKEILQKINFDKFIKIKHPKIILTESMINKLNNFQKIKISS